MRARGWLSAADAQADVEGQAITWLVPHAAGQVLPTDVDYRVMLTFLEFYHTLLKFVFFKLYAGLGLRYPPAVDAGAERVAAELAAIVDELRGRGAPAAEEGLPAASHDGLTAADSEDCAARAPGTAMSMRLMCTARALSRLSAYAP